MTSTAKRKSSIESENTRHSLSSGGNNSFQFSLPDLEGYSGASQTASQTQSAGSKRKASVENSSVASPGRIPSKKRKASHDYESLIDDHALGFSLGSDVIARGLEGGSLAGSHISPSVQIQQTGNSALEHLEALGDSGNPASKASAQKLVNTEDINMCLPAPTSDDHSHSTFASSSQRLLLEAFFSGNAIDNKGRDRLESWGGMSDLSFPVMSDNNSTAAAAALAASALHQSGIIDDVAGTANLGLCGESAGSSGTKDPTKPEAIPSRISLGRDRINSIASLSEASAIPIGMDGMELSTDLQAFVAAAMASVGDQLAELAGAVESAASGTESFTIDAVKKELGIDSDASSIASPLVHGTGNCDISSKVSLSGLASVPSFNPPSEFLASSGAISVDYDAVAAAVDAAEAATGALDLASISHIAAAEEQSLSSTETSKRKCQLKQQKGSAECDLNTCVTPDGKVLSTPSRVSAPKSKMSEKELEVIRERARAAAGYIPPGSAENSCLPPAKKRQKCSSETLDGVETKQVVHDTPKVSNTSVRQPTNVPFTSFSPPQNSTTKVTKGQSSQKWDSMFECLLEFIKERREGETKGATEQEISLWTWDGNVPTTYKTTDGKALGRWINNQRSAKSKGTLKKDREQRLVDAGLKWSVLASNSWNEMLEELRDYVKEQTKEGRKWDGNVPTNYRIKAKASGRLIDEDKNLGRWVNRQRSLYQAGKLRKDRQLALEKVGLKWSMLATTSWESMFETLCEYVEEKKKEGRDWDGNVPANYRTSDNPPRALGRWINRQRSAYVKSKLKEEYVEKLNTIGLKWSVHERKLTNANPNETTSSEAKNPTCAGDVDDGSPGASAVMIDMKETSKAEEMPMNIQDKTVKVPATASIPETEAANVVKTSINVVKTSIKLEEIDTNVENNAAKAEVATVKGNGQTFMSNEAITAKREDCTVQKQEEKKGLSMGCFEKNIDEAVQTKTEVSEEHVKKVKDHEPEKKDIKMENSDRTVEKAEAVKTKFDPIEMKDKGIKIKVETSEDDVGEVADEAAQKVAEVEKTDNKNIKQLDEG